MFTNAITNKKLVKNTYQGNDSRVCLCTCHNMTLASPCLLQKKKKTQQILNDKNHKIILCEKRSKAVVSEFILVSVALTLSSQAVLHIRHNILSSTVFT